MPMRLLPQRWLVQVAVLSLSFATSFLFAQRDAESVETLRIASSLFKNNNPDAAISALREHLSSHPDDAAVRMELARYLSFVKRFGESEQQYKALLQQDPDNLHAQVGLAKIASWQGEWDAAV